MSPQQQDRPLALTSHLPASAGLSAAGILPGDWQNLTATGFRDTTRIAAAIPM